MASVPAETHCEERSAKPPESRCGYSPEPRLPRLEAGPIPATNHPDHIGFGLAHSLEAFCVLRFEIDHPLVRMQAASPSCTLEA